MSCAHQDAAEIHRYVLDFIDTGFCLYARRNGDPIFLDRGACQLLGDEQYGLVVSFLRQECVEPELVYNCERFARRQPTDPCLRKEVI